MSRSPKVIEDSSSVPGAHTTGCCHCCWLHAGTVPQGYTDERLWFQDMEKPSWARLEVPSMNASIHKTGRCYASSWESMVANDPAWLWSLNANAIGVPCRCMAAMGKNRYFTVEFKVHTAEGHLCLMLKTRIKLCGWVLIRSRGEVTVVL